MKTYLLVVGIMSYVCCDLIDYSFSSPVCWIQNVGFALISVGLGYPFTSGHQNEHS